jgi:hypothetical protein
MIILWISTSYLNLPRLTMTSKFQNLKPEVVAGTIFSAAGWLASADDGSSPRLMGLALVSLSMMYSSIGPRFPCSAVVHASSSVILVNSPVQVSASLRFIIC